MLNKKLLEILVCPKCRLSLDYEQTLSTLMCNNDRLAFPIEDDIPVLLIEAGIPI